jgi:hypothetical protein
MRLALKTKSSATDSSPFNPYIAVAAEGSPYKKVEPARPDDVDQALNPANSAGAHANVKPGVLAGAADDSSAPRAVATSRAPSCRSSDGHS